MNRLGKNILALLLCSTFVLPQVGIQRAQAADNFGNRSVHDFNRICSQVVSAAESIVFSRRNSQFEEAKRIQSSKFVATGAEIDQMVALSKMFAQMDTTRFNTTLACVLTHYQSRPTLRPVLEQIFELISREIAPELEARRQEKWWHHSMSWGMGTVMGTALVLSLVGGGRSILSNMRKYPGIKAWGKIKLLRGFQRTSKKVKDAKDLKKLAAMRKVLGKGGEFFKRQFTKENAVFRFFKKFGTKDTLKGIGKVLGIYVVGGGVGTAYGIYRTKGFGNPDQDDLQEMYELNKLSTQAGFRPEMKANPRSIMLNAQAAMLLSCAMDIRGAIDFSKVLFGVWNYQNGMPDPEEINDLYAMATFERKKTSEEIRASMIEHTRLEAQSDLTNEELIENLKKLKASLLHQYGLLNRLIQECRMDYDYLRTKAEAAKQFAELFKVDPELQWRFQLKEGEVEYISIDMLGDLINQARAEISSSQAVLMRINVNSLEPISVEGPKKSNPADDQGSQTTPEKPVPDKGNQEKPSTPDANPPEKSNLNEPQKHVPPQGPLAYLIDAYNYTQTKDSSQHYPAVAFLNERQFMGHNIGFIMGDRLAFFQLSILDERGVARNTDANEVYTYYRFRFKGTQQEIFIRVTHEDKRKFPAKKIEVSLKPHSGKEYKDYEVIKDYIGINEKLPVSGILKISEIKDKNFSDWIKEKLIPQLKANIETLRKELLSEIEALVKEKNDTEEYKKRVGLVLGIQMQERLDGIEEKIAGKIDGSLDQALEKIREEIVNLADKNGLYDLMILPEEDPAPPAEQTPPAQPDAPEETKPTPSTPPVSPNESTQTGTEEKEPKAPSVQKTENLLKEGDSSQKKEENE